MTASDPNAVPAAGTVPLGRALATGLTGALAIALLTLLARWSGMPLLLAPFGASCVLLFALPDSPLAQPRALIGGHVLSSLVGLVALHVFGGGLLAPALAVGAAIALMQLTRTTHPPAGADPLVVLLGGAPWSFLLAPVLIGALLLVGCALLANNLRRGGDRYPRSWV